MDLLLTGKRAVVTGAAGGIGREVAHALAAEGVDLVLTGRTAATLEKTAAAVTERSGRSAHVVVVDVRDDAAVRAMVDRAVEVLGGVDILVNSASNQAVGRHMPRLAETGDDVFWDDVDTKLVGYLRTSRAVAPHLVAQGWGRIINIAGLGARETRSIVRTVRNVGVAALTKNLADELGPHGVNVTAVHPGLTRTPELAEELTARAAAEGRTLAELEDELGANALNRLVDATEVADVVAFLASPRSVAVNGDAVGVGGGTRGVVHY
ncbi:SDR family oxidoreductase [Nocardioides anomalus]|uniref:SDR family oxidoreductase n=1 Tax=Nocardioides anomalus TaxID=2712223 RepID=A0A6G6WCS0_9ACTN|nr:SDR family oxidoreductase [Nocardioides anomalus]QIG42895.1 SDR family oxidoreductase [Nocardioides anomalus]